MTQQQSPDDNARAPIDRTRASRGGGSIGLVLLMALVLIGAAGGLLFIGRAKAEPYILALLAVLAMVGVFLAFALAAGILRTSGREAASPLLKAVVDGANEGILVTDASGRVLYANGAYLRLVEAPGPQDVRPVERVFVGDPGVSEAVYRLLKAAREGRRSQEEVRIGAHAGEAARWLRIRVRPLGEGKRESRMTVWSLADVTRELERHENVFQELQHAIDYLDHAPAGFFSAEGNGNIVYLNATLANWLDHDLAQVGSGGLKLEDIVAGEGTALLLGPLAVRPAYKNLGIGRRLVRIAVEAAEKADAAAVLLVGDAPYYGPLGFTKIPRGQLSMPRPVDLDRILVVELKPGAAAALTGMVDHEDRTKAALSLLPVHGEKVARRAG